MAGAAVLLLAVFTFGSATPIKERFSNNAYVIDGHNDWPYTIRDVLGGKINNFCLNEDLSGVQPFVSYSSSFTDLIRMRKGRIGGQFWSVFVSCESQDKNSVTLTLEQIDLVKRIIDSYPEVLQFATSSDEVARAVSSGKIASFIGVEGGHSVDNSLGVLRMYYELGVRYLTLTHNCDTPWATSHRSESERGLSLFGKRLISEMNRLGMLIDLSHVSDATMFDAITTSKSPPFFSHSGIRSVCNHSRNVPDEILNLIRQKEGIVMIVFLPEFVACGSNSTIHHVAGKFWVFRLQNCVPVIGNPGNNVSLDAFKPYTLITLFRHYTDHIDYVRNRYGIDYVGIGADFDGYSGRTRGLEDVSKYPALFEILTNRGWTEDELEKLGNKNLLRVLEKTEQVRDSLKDELPAEDAIPMEDLKDSDCRFYWRN